MSQGGAVWFNGGVLVALAIAIWPARSTACVSIQEPALVGFPAHGAVDVPTNVIPFYDTLAAGMVDVSNSSFRVATMDNEVIALQARTNYVHTVELLPERELSPNTTYTLTALVIASPSLTLEQTLTFTTGEGPFTTTPEQPDALLEHVRVRNAKVSSCGGLVAATCLAAKGALPFDVTYVDGFGFGREQARYLFESARFSIDLAKVDDQWDYSCLKLRARAPHGELSEAVQLCGGDASLFEVDSNDDLSCRPEGLVQDDVLVRDVEQDQRDLTLARKTSSGCNVTRKPHGSSAAVAAQLALLLFLGARSSSRRRRAR